jgi:mono/diheme cytochrome c family protein
MMRVLFAILAIVVVGAGAFAALAYRPAIAAIEPVDAGSLPAEQVERGRVLAAAGNCASCHGENYAGGRGIASDFGTIYATNITPDAATGIGTWSEAAFARAMRKGVRRDGAHLFPAFPYTHFAKLTDDDVSALYAYVMSRPAVASEVPQTKLDGVANWRALQGGWKLLYFKGAAFTPNPEKSEAWNRGAYLAEGVGHCSACHSPRNQLGGELTGAMAYAGALVDNWYAPAINAVPDAELPWTAGELYAYLRTGASALHGVASGTMSEVVHESLSALPDSDIEALAAYFADVAGAPAEIATADVEAALAPTAAELSDNARRGELIYVGYCVSCHFNRADAPSPARPELTVNSAVVGPDPSTFLRVLIGGVTEADGNPDAYMPGFAYVLSDRDIADVASYLRASFASSDDAGWSNLEARAAEIRALNQTMR